MKGESIVKWQLKYLMLALIGGLPAVTGLANAADSIASSNGNIEITPIKHSQVQIEFAGKVIHVDPIISASIFASGKAIDFKPADLILITDIHGYHYHPASIDKVRKATTQFVVPREVAGKIGGDPVVMGNGDSRTLGEISIDAIPMYNLVRGSSQGLYHTKGRGNGYVLRLGGKRLLFAGDTECTAELKALAGIDVAFIPMNMFTMSPAEAADCVKAFKPKIVYAYHYWERVIEPANKNQLEFISAMKGVEGIDVRTPNFYP